ncbi:ABC transporter permease [Peribacillus cavernae]|uniref:ABC transporter permease n=1 Tax=Peribacillus cavernae TaxID=1674310 RepID=UPI00163C74BB|nr:ABC transporter permease [Peribacillus cavernae]MDQ0220698.1 ribose transport system permease protein [Peribacillus cavernae]
MKVNQETTLSTPSFSFQHSILKFITKSYLLIFLCLLVIVCSFISDKFLTFNNLSNILLQNSVISIIALGQLMVVITGGIDLSVGSIAALASVLSASLLGMGVDPIVSIILVMLLMAIAGLGNGLAVTYGKITPFVVTLATLTIYRGLAYIFQVGSLVTIEDRTFLSILAGKTIIGGVYTPVIILLITLGIFIFILRMTTFGRRLYAIGGNSEAARLAGAPINRDIITAYAISGALAGLGGLIMTARLSTGSALYAQGYELDVIAAVVVGGASLMGGKGFALNAVLGAFLIGIIRNILNLTGVASYPQMVIQGLIILVAVLLTTLAARKKA